MQFLTEVKIAKADFELMPCQPILMIGSCFTDNIGAKFINSMWPVKVNPCGVQYNPASISQLVCRALEDNPMTEQELVKRDDIWLSWLFDSHFSSTNKADALSQVNEALSSIKNALNNAQCIIITLGTSWIYRLKDCSDKVVSNCHKFPAEMFERERLTVNQSFEMLKMMILKVRMLNPEVRFVFTVSPIRHFKDGAHQNMLSKSSLLLAVEKLCKEISNVEYFQAYEVMMDELRDYRFYASDMLHPSQVAIDYIWQRFREWCFSSEADKFVDEGTKLTARLHHRPITQDKQKIEEFRTRTQILLSEFKRRYPYAVITKEI